MSGTEMALMKSEVEGVAKASRRRLTVAYKRKIVREADGCKTPGAVGALLRRKGLYASHLSGARAVRARWRASRKGRGAADGLGTVYGVTRERIWQLEMMGLKKLSRGPLRERLASFIGG